MFIFINVSFFIANYVDVFVWKLRGNRAFPTSSWKQFANWIDNKAVWDHIEREQSQTGMEKKCRGKQTAHLLRACTFLIEQKTISWASAVAREKRLSSCWARCHKHSLTRSRSPPSYGFSAFASWSRGGESPQTRAGRGGWFRDMERGREGDAWQTAPNSRSLSRQVSQPVAESCSECRRSIGMCTLSLPEQRPWGHGGGQGWRGAGQLLVQPLAQPPVHPLQPHVRQVSRTHQPLSFSFSLSKGCFCSPKSRTLIFGSS